MELAETIDETPNVSREGVERCHPRVERKGGAGMNTLQYTLSVDVLVCWGVDIGVKQAKTVSITRVALDIPVDE